MLLLTQYSDSHKQFVDKYITPYSVEFDKVLSIHLPQVCKSGTYGKEGFNEHMYLKLDCLSEIPINTPTLYIDADCLILPGLAQWCSEWLKTNQQAIGCGNDSDSHSMGVLLFTQSTETLEWWKHLKTVATTLGLHDQEALNWVLVNEKPTTNLKLLSKNIFANWSPGLPWEGESIHTPPEMLCWHANYCIGIQNKTKMLEMVYATYRSIDASKLR